MDSLNQAIDDMLKDDETSTAEELLAKVKSMCAAVSIIQLKNEIEVHRRLCREISCPVLAAMEDQAALTRSPELPN